jgi:hypothetical protein
MSGLNNIINNIERIDAKVNHLGSKLLARVQLLEEVEVSTSTSIHFISDALVGKNQPGNPSTAYVQTYINSLSATAKENLKDSIMYYSGGTNPSYTFITHVWYYSKESFLIEIQKPTVIIHNFKIQQGITPLTSANNGDTSELLIIPDTSLRLLTNFKVRVLGSASSGSMDILIKKIDGTLLSTNTIANMSFTNVANLSTPDVYSNFTLGGLYLEVQNITGSVAALNVNFEEYKT